MRHVVLGAVVLILALSAAAWWFQPGWQSRRDRSLARYREGRSAYTVASTELTGMIPRTLFESSGVAVSRRYPGVLWTHNDGDDSLLYAIDLQGELLGAFELRGAHLRDWEDIDLGPCPRPLSRDDDCLYIADLGDNQRRRSLYTVYIGPEPDPSVLDSSRNAVGPDLVRLDFVYPDSRHDAEALAVAPSGDVSIVTKGRNGRIQHFVIAREVLERGIGSGDTVTLASSDSIPIVPISGIGRMVTGAAISPSGVTLAVRTYTEVYLFTRQDNGSLLPPPEPCFLGLIEPLGEAVDFLDEETLVLTSEWERRQQGTIYRARC